MQLDLLEKDPIKLLLDRIEKLETAQGNLRRGIFARHAELAKIFVAHEERIDRIERGQPERIPGEKVEGYLFDITLYERAQE